MSEESEEEVRPFIRQVVKELPNLFFEERTSVLSESINFLEFFNEYDTLSVLAGRYVGDKHIISNNTPTLPNLLVVRVQGSNFKLYPCEEQLLEEKINLLIKKK